MIGLKVEQVFKIIKKKMLVEDNDARFASSEEFRSEIKVNRSHFYEECMEYANSDAFKQTLIENYF